jgi:hypothetical protein
MAKDIVPSPTPLVCAWGLLGLLVVCVPSHPGGHRDLDGVWDFRTATPLQRPRDLGAQAFFDADQAADFEVRAIRQREEGLRRNPSVHPPEWLDYGTRVQPSLRTSLIVDPSHGRLPALTAEARARRETRREKARQPAHGPEDRSLWERCLVGFNAGPPLSPGAYNNNLRIVVTDDTVLLFTEMVHEARIVPLDGGLHPRPTLPRWQGNSSGRWEGDTLVVETTGFKAKTSFIGTGPGMRLVERFTRRDESTLLYEYTVDDPETFERVWSAELILRQGGDPIYEFACHEGNYGLQHILEAARAED